MDVEGINKTEVGLSAWITVDQARIDTFANVTEDYQFIHIDPIAAKATPYGGTIAHGFLTLSLISRMAFDYGFALKNASMVVNYGFEKVRFIDAVRCGARVRGRFKLIDVVERATGQMLVRHGVTVEIEGQEKPALVAEWLTLQFLDLDLSQQGAA